MSDAPKKRIAVGRLLLWVVLGSCIVIFALAAIGRANRPAATAQATQAPAAAVTAPTEPPAPTDLPRPSPVPASTRGPTETPAPTDIPVTPSPEPSPTEPPTPTPPPAPLVMEGSGQSVTDPFAPPTTVNRIVFSHTGRSNFIVSLYDKDGKMTGLVNAIGDYRGSRPLIGDDGPYYLEIKADGRWTAIIEPLFQDDELAQGLEGKGAHTSNLFAPAREGPIPYRFTHDGEANFIVHLVCAGGSDQVQNEIGVVAGEAVAKFARGPCLWDIQADGAWSIKPK